MKVTRRDDGEVYKAVDHHSMWGALKVKEGDDSMRTVVSLSHFLPDGGAKMKPSSRERVYFLLRGSVTVTGDKEEYVLNEGDCIYIGPNENRQVTVNNNRPATMLVVVVRTE